MWKTWPLLPFCAKYWTILDVCVCVCAYGLFPYISCKARISVFHVGVQSSWVASPSMESGHGIQNFHSFQGVTSSLRCSENNPHGHWTIVFENKFRKPIYIYILWDFMGKTWFSGRSSVRKWSFHIISISPMTWSTTRGPRGPLQTAPSETASSSAVLQICWMREILW